MNAFAKLGFHRLIDIERMTLNEYYIRIEAHELQRAEQIQDIALQAWYNQQVKATKGSAKRPKPYFDTFIDLYDFEAKTEAIRAQFEPDYVIQRMSRSELRDKRGEILAKRIQEFKQLKAQGKIIPLKQRGGSHGEL